MASPANITHNQPPYPTQAALQAAKQHISHTPDALKLLFWPLNADTGPALETSGLKVMAAAGPNPKYPDPDVRVPYYDTAAGGAGVWHPISKLPVSAPKVSELVVQAWDVADWARGWEDLHWEHELEDNRISEHVARGEGICHGCGVARPPAPKGDVSIVVRGTGGVSEDEDGGFVTVHDYVSTVHPWLVGLRGDILGAVGTASGNDDPLPVETELIVSCRLLDKLSVQKREDWIRNARKQRSPDDFISSLRDPSQQSGEAYLGPFGGFHPDPFMQQGRRRE